jgi:integrase
MTTLRTLLEYARRDLAWIAVNPLADVRRPPEPPPRKRLITPAVLDAAFRRARDRAGLSGFTFHDSRANALTRLAQVLAPLDLARMIGHRDLGSLLVYYRPSAASIAERLG